MPDEEVQNEEATVEATEEVTAAVEAQAEPAGETAFSDHALPLESFEQPHLLEFRQDGHVLADAMVPGTINSNSVWNLALALARRGFYRGPIVTEYTWQLEAGVRQFQVGQRLDETGIATQAVVERLGLEWIEI